MKIRKFHKCRLHVECLSVKPYVIKDNFKPTLKGNINEGFDIILLKTIAESLDISYNLKLIDETLFEYLLSNLYFGVELICGGLPLINEKYMFTKMSIKYSHLFLKSSLSWFVPLAQQRPRWKSLYTGFSPQLWLFIILSYFLIAFVLYIFNKTSLNIRVNNGFSHISNVLINTMNIFIGVSIHKPSKLLHFQIFFIFTLFFGFIINQAYQSVLFGLIVQPGFESQIQREGDILSTLDLCCRLPFINVFKNRIENKSFKNRLVYRENVYDCLNEIMLGEQMALIEETNYILYNLSKTIEPNVFAVPDNPVIVFYITLYFQEDSWFIKLYEKRILELNESGLLEYWWKQLILYKPQIFRNSFFALNLIHLQGAFFLLILGHTFALVIFFSEIIYSNIYHK